MFDLGIAIPLNVKVLEGLSTLSYDFISTQTLPSWLSYTRNDTVSTYRNSSGKLILATANIPRFDHSPTGTPLGIRSEQSRVNYCTNTNYNPADTSGFTVTGTATVTRVYQPTPLTNAGLELLCTNGYVQQLSGGASGGTVVISGDIGATGSCAASMYAAAVSGSGASFGITPSPTATVISGAALSLHKAEGLTATSTTDKLVITLPPFVSVWVILNQLERGYWATSSIVVAGATATRAAEVIRDLSYNTRSHYNLSKGGLVFEYTVDYNDGRGTGGSDTSYIGGIGDANFPTSRFTLYKLQTHGQPASLVSGGASQATGVPALRSGARKEKLQVAGIAWTNGSHVQSFSGPAIFGEVSPMVAAAAGIDEFYLGSAPNSTLQLNGHFRKIHILYGKEPSLDEMVALSWNSNDWAFVCGGQSNMEGYFASANTFFNIGERNINDTLDLYWTGRAAGARNVAINASVSGSSFISWQGTTSSITRWKKIVTAAMNAGIQIKAIAWDQGESDMGHTVASYKSNYLQIFTEMQNHLGYTDEEDFIPVVLVPMGRYLLGISVTNDQNVANHKQAYQELARDYSWIHLAPEKYHNPLYSSAALESHLTKEGYGAQGYLLARKVASLTGGSVSGGVDGPEITAISRSGAVYTCTVTHDGGTDFTPTTGIGGFRLYDGTTSTEIAVLSAVRTNANTITVTGASAPSNSTQILRYGFDQMYNTTNTQVVVDNNTYPLPLRSCEFRSTDSGVTWVNIV